MSNVSPNKSQPRIALARSQASSGHKCSFCGASEHDVYRLIAAQTEFICNQCVSKATSLLLERKAKIANPQPVMDLGFIYCSFCGKEAGEFKEAITCNNVTICNECLALCVDTLLKSEVVRNLAFALGS